MANASEALNSARTYLNDVNQQVWTDAILLPFLKEAYRDLLLALWLNGLQVLKEKSAVIDVAAAVNPSLTLPADFVAPISLKERADGSTSADDWVPMTEADWEPDMTRDTTLNYWAWREDAIQFVGATTAREVLLRYWKSLTIPTSGSSALGFVFAEVFLGPQTAGYAAGSIGNLTLASELLYINEKNVGVAGGKLIQIIKANVKSGQNLPVRRIPYRRFSRFRMT